MRSQSRTWPRLAGFAGLGFALVLLTNPTAPGQDTSGSSAPLSRYVPKDNLAFYIEFDGLDAHADAWRKTAACKILNGHAHRRDARRPLRPGRRQDPGGQDLGS